MLSVAKKNLAGEEVSMAQFMRGDAADRKLLRSLLLLDLIDLESVFLERAANEDHGAVRVGRWRIVAAEAGLLQMLSADV